MIDEPTLADLRATFDAQNAAFRAAPFPSADERRAHLSALHRAVIQHRAALIDAVNADFGGRSRHETELADVVLSLECMHYLRRNLRSFMRPQRRWVPSKMLLATARVYPQPLGVVGVMAPWNYPINLSLAPIATALAAGNRVLLKPSELTPRTSQVLATLLDEAFPDGRVTTVLGGPQVGADFATLPFHHLLFTGSTAVGRLVAQAAAPNLTPLTLELGGKSPAIVHPDYDLAHAVDSVVLGKLFNAGQTCIAPDYLLVQRDQLEQVVDLAKAAVDRHYPTLAQNTDYSAVINDRHRARLQHLLDDAAQRGARLIPLGDEVPAGGRMRPHLVLDAPDDAAILQEEIFGPLLPVIPYDTLDKALAYVNDRPRPLALYYFDSSASRRDEVLRQTISGGVTLNATVYHFAIESLPFGGVGASGMGAYHGPEGFRTFSHYKPVLHVSRLSSMKLVQPPYGRAIAWVMRWLFP